MPRAKASKRKLELYKISAHVNNSAADYSELLRDLSGIAVPHRVLDTDNRITCIKTITQIRGTSRFFIVALDGEPGLKPLLLDQLSAETRVIQTRHTEVVANLTHLLIDCVTRDVVIEYNRKGVKARDLSDTMNEILASLPKYSTLNIEFIPVASDEFYNAIDQMERIRIAELKLARPNYDWDDDYNVFMHVGQESNAQMIEISASAARNASLSTERGIIGLIKFLKEKAIAALHSAKIVGTYPQEASETRVSLENHFVHRYDKVNLTDSGHVDSKSIRNAMIDFLESRQE